LNGRNYRNMKNVQNFDEEPLGKYLVGIPRERYVDVIKLVLSEIGCKDPNSSIVPQHSVQHGEC
jgi:hypothetical protein